MLPDPLRRSIALAILAAVLASPASPQHLLRELTGHDTSARDRFGAAVALDGQRIVVGAPRADPTVVDSGAVYVFATASGAQLHHLIAADGSGSDRLGASVALHGHRAVAGAPQDDDLAEDAGSCYVFDVATGAQIAKFLASNGAFNDRFGHSVALNDDVVVVGAPGADRAVGNSGAAYVFDLATGQELHELAPSDPQPGAYFGLSVAVHGTHALVGSVASAAYLFDLTTGQQIARYPAAARAVALGPNHVLVADGTASTLIARGSGATLFQQPGGSAVALGLRMGIVEDRAYSLTSGALLFELEAHDVPTSSVYASALAAWRDLAVAGDWGHDEHGDDSGTAYLFELFIDCNQNGRPDSIDLAEGTSLDCNGNDVPDECDLAAGASPDCDANGIPDECDIASGASADCNGNGIPDSCDLLSGTSRDCDANEVPDECDYADLVHVPYCFCSEGSPCGNPDTDAGCANGGGEGARLFACGSSSVATDDLFLTIEEVPAQQHGLVFMGASPALATFGNGQLCVGGGPLGLYRFPARNAGPEGTFVEGPGIVAHSMLFFGVFGSISVGQTWYFQAWYRDPAGPCGASFNLSNGVAITFLP